MLSIHQCATLACILDVTAPKPGNVHRGADFEDMGFLDFAKSAIAIGPIMDRAPDVPLGVTILESIQATRTVVATNTNLGIVLLLGPLAKVGHTDRRSAAIKDVLSCIDAQDTRQVFQAIRLAQPGGLGQEQDMDVFGDAPIALMPAMQAACDRDLIAKQYVTGFELLLKHLVPRLIDDCQRFGLVLGIVNTHVWLLAREPDSLIARKCGVDVARQVSEQAKVVLAAADPSSTDYIKYLADLDFWLRSDGNRRNPGTTADLVTAAIFTGLLDDELDLIESP